MDNKYAIFRIVKLKDTKGIANVGNHNARNENTRKKQPDNIDSSRTKYNKIYKGDTQSLNLWKKRTKGIEPRKNGVLAYDIIASFSNEYAQHVDREKWAEKNIKFLENHFGKENVLNAFLHVDEKTTHMHFCVVPLLKDSQTGKEKFNARHFTGGGDTLSKLQDQYFESVKEFGFNRGYKGSRAKHMDLKTYYKKKSRTEEYLKKLSNKELLYHATQSEIRIAQLEQELDSYRYHEEQNQGRVLDRDKTIADLQEKLRYFDIKQEIISKLHPNINKQVEDELKAKNKIAKNPTLLKDYNYQLRNNEKFKGLLPSEQLKYLENNFNIGYTIDELPTTKVNFKENTKLLDRKSQYLNKIKEYDTLLGNKGRAFLNNVPQYLEAVKDKNIGAICGFLGALFSSLQQSYNNLKPLSYNDYIDYLMKNTGMGYEEAKKYFEIQKEKGEIKKGMIIE